MTQRRRFEDSPQNDPAYRLESLRFYTVERNEPAGVPVGLDAWMQEVEKQIVNLRKRLNEGQFSVPKGPRW